MFKKTLVAAGIVLTIGLGATAATVTPASAHSSFSFYFGFGAPYYGYNYGYGGYPYYYYPRHHRHHYYNYGYNNYQPILLSPTPLPAILQLWILQSLPPLLTGQRCPVNSWPRDARGRPCLLLVSRAVRGSHLSPRPASIRNAAHHKAEAVWKRRGEERTCAIGESNSPSNSSCCPAVTRAVSSLGSARASGQAPMRGGSSRRASADEQS